MTTTIPATTATTASIKTDVAPILLAAIVVSAVPILAGFGNDRKQPADMQTVALLADNTSIGVLIARQQLKMRVTIMAIILVERHGSATYLSVLYTVECPRLQVKTVHSTRHKGTRTGDYRSYADAITA